MRRSKPPAALSPQRQSLLQRKPRRTMLLMNRKISRE